MLACCVLIVVVVEQESLRLGVLRNWFSVRFFVCFGFRVFLGFCGWVPEALYNPAQMRMPEGPAFRGAPEFGELEDTSPSRLASVGWEPKPTLTRKSGEHVPCVGAAI